MPAKSNIQAFLDRNKQIASTHKPLPLFTEIPSLGISPPTVLIVTCLDPSCVPEKFLGLQPPETVVIRNVCGHIKPNLSDILAIDRIFQFPELMVIHHTDCGSMKFTDVQVRETLRARQPENEAIETMNFGSITDLEQSVRDDLTALRESTLVRKELAENASGFIFDIQSGLVTKVVD